MGNKIILFEKENASIHITNILGFDNDGNLRFEGFDSGKTVKELYGIEYHEYLFCVDAKEVFKFYRFYQITEMEQMDLLLAIKKRHNTKEAFSQLKIFMKENEIKFSQFYD